MNIETVERLFDHLDEHELIHYTRSFTRSKLIYALSHNKFKAWEVLGYNDRCTLNAYFRKNIKIKNTSTWEASVLGILGYSKCVSCSEITETTENNCTSCLAELNEFKELRK